MLVRGPSATPAARFRLTAGGWRYSDESGRHELYVQPFPGSGGRLQVSKQGAWASWWTRDGRQLLFPGDDLHTIWRAEVQTGRHADRYADTDRHPSTDDLGIDASPDRQRFLAIAPERTGPGR